LAPICTPVGGAPSVIKDGHNGLLVPVGDATALATAIRRLHNDREQLRQMRAAAIETARAYQWEQLARRTLDVYRQAMASRGRI
jgi:D-inositol-3-phosphate glycosyltransferase